MLERLSTAGASILSTMLRVAGRGVEWLAGLDWNRVAVILGIVVSVATYFTNLYFQRRQLRTIEQRTFEQRTFEQRTAGQRSLGQRGKEEESTADSQKSHRI